MKVTAVKGSKEVKRRERAATEEVHVWKDECWVVKGVE